MTPADAADSTDLPSAVPAPGLPSLPILPGPLWTRNRLHAMLIDCYGPSQDGGVRTTLVARYCGVAPSTVRHWLTTNASEDDVELARIPPERIRQLQLAPPVTERRNQQRADYAADAIAKLGLARGKGILPAWRTQGWLLPHVVAVLDHVESMPWRQVVVTIGDTAALAKFRRRGELVDVATLPSRFHAQLVAHAMMVELANWRVHPADHILAAGRTQVWFDDAPAVEVSRLAAALKLR